MLLDTWDHRVSDLLSAIQTFIKESNIPITYNQEHSLITIHSLYYSTEEDVILSYTGDTLNGFAIVQKDDQFSTEPLGYISKFYVLPDRRHTRAAFQMMQECVDWLDRNGCVLSYCTATAGIGRDTAFIKLVSKFGYTADTTGILTRKRNVKI